MPSRVLVRHEANHNSESGVIQEVLRLLHCQNILGEGTLRQMLEHVGFKDVDLEDLTAEVLLIWWLLAVIAYVPYRFLQIFGLQSRSQILTRDRWPVIYLERGLFGAPIWIRL